MPFWLKKRLNFVIIKNLSKKMEQTVQQGSSTFRGITNNVFLNIFNIFQLNWQKITYKDGRCELKQ